MILSREDKQLIRDALKRAAVFYDEAARDAYRNNRALAYAELNRRAFESQKLLGRVLKELE